MALSLGASLPEFNNGMSWTNAVNALAAVDNYKNCLADSLSLAHSDGASGHLYPTTMGVWETVTDPGANTRGPQGVNFPEFELMTGLARRGITPIIYLELTGTDWHGWGSSPLWDPSVSTWANHRDGVYDWFWDRFATDCKSWAHTLHGMTTVQGDPISCRVIVRLCGEMNASSLPWRTTDGGTNTTFNTPTKFIDGWKHIHDRVRLTNGATNAYFLYTPWPTAESTTSITANWPGDDWTEYPGADIYCDINQIGDTWADVQSLRSKLNATYTELTGLTAKPIIIGEGGVTRANTKDTPTTYFDDADRASWVSGTGWAGAGAAGGFDYVRTNMSQVRVFNYFDISGWYYTASADAHAYPTPPLNANLDYPLTIDEIATYSDANTTRLAVIDPSTVGYPPRRVFTFG